MTGVSPGRGAWLVGLTLALVLGCAQTDAPASGGEARTHTVEMRAMGFEPAELFVEPGDTVVWINRDFVPHTVTAADSAWTSPTLEVGAQWSRVANETGVVDYLCQFHPMMRARMTIGSAKSEPTHD